VEDTHLGRGSIVAHARKEPISPRVCVGRTLTTEETSRRVLERASQAGGVRVVGVRRSREKRRYPVVECVWYFTELDQAHDEGTGSDEGKRVGWPRADG
jgi:hypothetical protein